MIWQGRGLILDTQKHSESNLIITLFTEDKGMLKMLVRGGQSKRRYSVFQVGNIISCVWKARLEEHLGSVSSEAIIENYAAKFLSAKHKLLALKTILELIIIATKTGEIYPILYKSTIEFLTHLKGKDFDVEHYINYELRFLSEIGYGLDLSKCAVTGRTKDLYYVSPRTGCAVIKSVGAKYHDRLIMLPEFLQGKTRIVADIRKAFYMTGYFIEKHLLKPNYLKMPYSRLQLQASLA